MAKVLNVDFTGVSEGGGSRIPAGDYIFKITGVEQKQSKKEGGGAYLNWKLSGVNGDAKGATLFEITSLKPAALWNLYNFLISTGYNVPKNKVKIDLDKVVGKFIGCTIDDEEYTKNDGTKAKKSSVVSTFAVKKTSDGKWVKVGVEDDEPEEEPELDVVDELDDEPEIEETPPPKKPQTKKPNTKKPETKKPAPKPEPGPENDDLDVDGEDEGDPNGDELDLEGLEDELNDLENELD